MDDALPQYLEEVVLENERKAKAHIYLFKQRMRKGEPANTNMALEKILDMYENYMLNSLAHMRDEIVSSANRED